MTLAGKAADYIAVKQASGLSYGREQRLPSGFAAYAEARGDRFVRTATALEWASRAVSRDQRVVRLRIVRGFALYLHAEDGRCEIPHRDAFGRRSRHRPPPRLLSSGDIRLVMDAALDLPPPGSLTPHTFHAVPGLLASTGMRRSEALGLRLEDLKPDGIEVRSTKSGRSRLLPLDGTVEAALKAYLRKRGSGAPGDPLFIMPSGRSPSPDHLTRTFVRLARQTGLRGKAGTPGPRLHDLRHSFAARVLAADPGGCRHGISRRAPALSTYLGHSGTAETYWYLTATPAPLGRISAETEEFHRGERR